MFSLAMVFSSLFTDVAQGIIVENYRSSLQTIGTFYRQLRFSSVPIIDDLFDETEVQDYLFGREDKQKAMIGCFGILENAVARNFYVHSIYIYNEDFGFFSSLNGEENPNFLSDSSLLAFLNEQPRNQRLYQRQSVFTEKGISFSGETTEGGAANLYTICRNSYDANGKLKYAIVMNLSETMARDLLGGDNEQAIKNFYMIDEEHNIISHPDKTKFGSSADESLLLSQVVSFVSADGSARITDETGEQYLACWSDLSQMNWRLLYLLPMSYLTEPLDRLRADLVLVFLSILAIANILLVLESKRVNRQLSRENRLVNYLHGNIDDSSFAYGPNHRFFLAILHVHDDSKDPTGFSNQNHLEFLSHYLRTDRNGNHAFLLLSGKDVFVYLSDTDDPAVLSKLRKMAIDTPDSIDVSLSVLYDENPVPFSDLPKRYKEILDRLLSLTLERQGFVEGYGSSESKPVNFFLSETSEIENSLRIKSMEEYGKAIGTLVANLRVQEDYELFCSMRNYLGYSIVGICSSLFERSEIFDKEGWKTEMLESRTYDELHEALMEIAALMEEEKRNASNKHVEQLVTAMKEVVAENLFDLNLSSTLVADKVGLSLGYARNLFKEREGVSINEYYGRLRVEQACTLLAQTDESINAIREQLGFSNTSYFCTYFKKTKGLSPSAYRQEHRLAK
jgi:YesN/AraC family two-component response regulator